MLVLSRKPGERIEIGENISVVVVAVRGQWVRLGVDAPRDVRVLRDELYPPDEGCLSPDRDSDNAA